MYLAASEAAIGQAWCICPPPSPLDAVVLSILRNTKKVEYKVIDECVPKSA